MFYYFMSFLIDRSHCLHSLEALPFEDGTFDLVRVAKISLAVPESKASLEIPFRTRFVLPTGQWPGLIEVPTTA
jgi:hypothetical protein